LSLLAMLFQLVLTPRLIPLSPARADGSTTMGTMPR
jgi:hypothetical protein